MSFSKTHKLVIVHVLVYTKSGGSVPTEIVLTGKISGHDSLVSSNAACYVYNLKLSTASGTLLLENTDDMALKIYMHHSYSSSDSKRARVS